MTQYGWGFIKGPTWDPNTRVYGVLPEIWGTMYSSLLALFIGIMFGLAVAIFLSEHYLAAFVFALMILPTISAISLNALLAVPRKLREAAYGLGATRWESILAILLPTASKGIFGAIILAFGRALGETMALGGCPRMEGSNVVN